MLLLTFHQWIGPGRDCPADKKIQPLQSTVAFATRQSLSDALVAIRKYQDEYNIRFRPRVALEFRLLGVAQIEEVDTAVLDGVDVTMVEALMDGLPPPA